MADVASCEKEGRTTGRRKGIAPVRGGRGTKLLYTAAKRMGLLAREGGREQKKIVSAPISWDLMRNYFETPARDISEAAVIPPARAPPFPNAFLH